MGLGSFFSKVRDGFRNFNQKLKTGFQNIAPKVMKIGGFVTNLLSNLPGKLGKAAGLINNGFNFARKAINYLPNSDFKKKLLGLTDQGEQKVNYVRNKVNPYVDKLSQYGDAGGKILNMIGGSKTNVQQPNSTAKPQQII